MKTGEIWLAQLESTVGREKQKTRPFVVISPGEMNANLRTVIVAPMTTGSRPARFRIPLIFQGRPGLIVLDRIRTLDRVRPLKRLGALRPSTLINEPSSVLDDGISDHDQTVRASQCASRAGTHDRFTPLQ